MNIYRSISDEFPYQQEVLEYLMNETSSTISYERNWAKNEKCSSSRPCKPRIYMYFATTVFQKPLSAIGLIANHLDMIN
jgi:hypothetical protein